MKKDTVKEMFDATIHLGQFSLDEKTRIACKNAQIKLINKHYPSIIHNIAGDLCDVLGVVTFSENTETDHTIRETLSRDEQDVFYPWMDVYHTIKNVQKVRDANTSVQKTSLNIQSQYNCSAGSASIIAAAIDSGCQRIITLYPDMLEPLLVDNVAKDYGINIQKPHYGSELSYQSKQEGKDTQKVFDLEDLYQQAMTVYKQKNIDLLRNLLMLQQKEGR